MTATKTPLCTVKGCPASKDPDWHIPWCGHGTAGEHQHWPKRSQGGKRIVAFLCHDCHDRIDNGDWGNAVFDRWGEETYRAWDLHNKTLIERIIGVSSPAVEQQTNIERSREADSSTAEQPVGADQPGESESLGPLAARQSLSAPAGYESWAKDIKAIAMVGRLWQFDLGDRALQGEKEFGEEAWQILDGGLGLARATIWNIMRVCESIPSSLRRGDLRWSHHQVIYKQDKETIDSWLDRCVEERWTIKQFKSALREEGLLPPKKTVKRWSLGELRDRASDAAHGEMTCCQFDGSTTNHFLDWLEAQDS